LQSPFSPQSAIRLRKNIISLALKSFVYSSSERYIFIDSLELFRNDFYSKYCTLLVFTKQNIINKNRRKIFQTHTYTKIDKKTGFVHIISRGFKLVIRLLWSSIDPIIYLIKTTQKNWCFMTNVKTLCYWQGPEVKTVWSLFKIITEA